MVASVAPVHPSRPVVEQNTPAQKTAVQPPPPVQVVEPIAPKSKKIDSVQQAGDSLNWSELVFELKLEGIAKQLAMNSVVQSFIDNRLQLVFLPELDVMLKPEVEAQIKQAIERKLGVSLALEFASKASLGCETPHEADIRKQEQHRQQVIQSIKQDPVVMQLNTIFGAELIEDSVKKQL